MSTLFPFLALIILFIGVPWLVLHYVTKMQSQSRLSPNEERMMEELWTSARDMRRRIETIEKILDLKKEKRTDDNE